MTANPSACLKTLYSFGNYYTGIGIPRGYASWNDAIVEFVQMRGDPNMTPVTAPVNVWNTFEILATLVLPKICG